MIKTITLLSVLGTSLLAHSLYASDSNSGSWHRAEYVYVETNIKTPNGNSIAGFSRDSSGDLHAVPGSPFLTGGAGIQYAGTNVGPPDSDQEIITNADHSLLFAVNSGSDTIAVFCIHDNGSLTPVEGSPFPSGGNNPVSLALRGTTLFVANKSGDPGRPTAVPPNYTTLQVQRGGRLVPSGDSTNDTTHRLQSTVSVAAGSSPTQVFTVPFSNLIFGADFLGGLIQRFEYDWKGGLHQLSPLALPADQFTDTTTPRLPLGIWSHPYLPLLYVGFVTANKLGVYEYGQDGHLRFIRAVPNSGAAICWLRTNSSGTRLYSTDTGTNSVSVYSLSNPEEPREIQNLSLSGLGNVLQFSLSTDEKYLYALSSRGSDSIPEGQGNILHVLSVEGDGTVAETGSPIVFHLPADTRPQGVLVVPGN